ncbi:hypothetical protein CHS0354_028785 [Potamilus streckersoni]|uniref:Uncharacterized protein n=1 Tax=Potamilus streckersoni TaxID=2493646 RepID=A0AAE0S8L8_9BIVA|nr:hypothetical protein CHS0354_028785 [Potamilus streckersoni]
MEKGYINAEHSTELLGEMFELWKGNKYCDAVLILQNERYKLHKLVLMAACPNILRYLAHNDVNNIFEIYIPEHVDESAVRLVLDYLYSGTVQLKTDSVYEIEKLANQLRLGTLSRFCHEFISQWETETLSLDQTQDERVQEHILKKLSPGSHLIKTESDASSSFPQVKKTSLTKGNTTNLIPGGTIDTCNPLDNLSEDDQETINCLATTLAAAVCESYDSSLDKESDQDESEEDSESVSNQTSTVKRLDSNQGNTISNPSPGPSRTSTQRPVCGSGDDIDLIMTAEEENDEDSDNNWGPQEDQMDMDYHSESSPEKFTKTKKQKAIIEPKTKRRKLNDKPAEECSGINVKVNQGDIKNGSESDGKSRHFSRYGRTLKPSISYGTINSLKIDGSEDGRMQLGSSKRSKVLTDGQEVSEDLASKRKDKEKPLDAAELESMVHKIKVSEYAEKLGLEAAAAHFDASKDTIKDWMLLKNYFKKKTQKAKKKSVSKLNLQNYIKIGEHTDLEDKVINWLMETKYNPNLTDGLATIGSKSTEIAKETGKPDLKIGIPWVKHVLERYVSVTKTDETGEVCTEEFRLKVTDYAREHGVKAASDIYGLDVNTVGWWTRKYRTKVVCKKDGELNPNAKSPARKRYTANFKIEAVKCAEKLGNRAAARIYGVPETNVRLWRKHKEQLSHSKGNVLKLKPTISPRQYSLLESLVKHWIISERRKITGAEIRAKALSFAEQANSPGFKGSHKWFYQFVKCHSLQQYVKTECSKEENFEFEKRKEVARSLERDSHGRFKSKPGEGFLSNEFKLEVVRFAETNGNDEAVKKYGINQTVICDWRLKKSYLSQRISAQKEKEKESAGFVLHHRFPQ